MMQIDSEPNITNEFYLQWHITDRCNLRCNHCYQEDFTGNFEMSLDDLISIADDLLRVTKKWNKKAEFSITGGEPFVRKDFLYFLEYLNSQDNVSNIDILSNGTLITEQQVKKLKKISKLKSVQISLDGASSKTHDLIRGKGSFEKAINGIRKLKEYAINVKIMFTLQRFNKDDIPYLYDLSLKENVKSITIERTVPIGSAKNLKEYLLSPAEIRQIFEYIYNRDTYEKQMDVLKYRPLWINFKSCDYNIITDNELGAVCSIGLDGICILPDATVLPCRRLPIPIGNLKRDSLEKIWFTSDLLWQIRDKNNLKGKCNSCEYISRCSGCRAMAYAYTGDFMAEDPHCWK
jgi:radical SAM protein with 4Fe4S-binding SPASM domain